VAKIELDINDDLIKHFGIKAIKDYIEKELKLIRLQELSDEIGQTLIDKGITEEEWTQELDKAKKEAWEEYKKLHREYK
jgi:hypothetical protein